MVVDTLNVLIDNTTRSIIEVVNFVILSGMVSVFGMVGNVLNIIVFIRMGTKDSITLNFIALSVSDFCSLLSLMWVSVCFNPLLVQAKHLPFDPVQFQYVLGSWGHASFARVTGIITALITMERCVCVVYPLRVKQLFTPRRTAIMIAMGYSTVAMAMVLVLYANQFGPVFSVKSNATIIGIIRPDNFLEIEGWCHIIFSVVLQLTSSITVAASTVVLAVALKKKTQWRKTTLDSGTKEEDNMSTRDKKISRMVVTISTIYIVSYIPQSVGGLAMLLSEDFNISGRNVNAMIVYFSFSFLLEANNSLTTTFVYFNMSAKFKETFLQLIPFCARAK